MAKKNFSAGQKSNRSHL